MASNSPENPVSDPHLQELLVQYLEAVERGESPDRQAMLQQHPQYASQLAQFFAGRDEVARLVEPLRKVVAADAAGSSDPDEPTLAAQAPAGIGPGTRVRYFGDYELLEEVARGGMGVVFKARQVRLNRIVALKMILAGQLASEADVARFYAEAEAAAQLDHPGITAIYEVGQHEGQHYYSMAFVEGPSLAARLALGPLPAGEAARLVGQVALAVQYAHEKGVIHRDLKPANILLAAGSQPRITDFGLAKRVQGDSGLTATGQILGTPSYMPPEQAAGRLDEVRETADVYALGAVLYALLTGRPPLQADNPLDTLLQVLQRDPIAPRALNPDIPKDLDTICLKCLEKDRRRRYPSARELAAELARFERGEPIQARPLGRPARAWRWSRRNPALASVAAAAIGLACAIVVGSVWSAWCINQARQAEMQSAAAARASAGESRHRLVRQLVSEGQRLADAGDLFGSLVWFVEALRESSELPAEQAVHRQRIGAMLGQCPTLVHELRHDGPVNHAEFSADGSLLVTSGDDHAARLWDVQSGKPAVPAMEHARGMRVHWSSISPDGRQVATAAAPFSGNGRFEVSFWDAATGRLLGTLPHQYAPRRVEWTGDSRRLVTVSFNEIGRDYYGWRVELWDAVERRLIATAIDGKGGEVVVFARLRADGQRLVASDGAGGVRTFSAVSGEPLTPLVKHADVVGFAALDEEGQRLLTMTRAWNQAALVQVWNLQTGAQIGGPLRHDAQPIFAAFGEDADSVTTLSIDGVRRNWDLPSGRIVKKSSQSLGELPKAWWSVDGRRFASRGANAARVWDLASGGALSPLLPHAGAIQHVAFAADADVLATAGRDSTVRLWRLSAPQVIAPPPVRLEDVVIETVNTWISSDARTMLIRSPDRSYRLWDTASFAPIGPAWQVGFERATTHWLAPDVRHVVFDPAAGIVAYESQSGKSHQILPRPTEGKHQPVVFFSANGKRIFAGFDGQPGQAACIWNVETSTALPLPEIEFSEGSAFTPDGSRLVLLGSGKAQLLDANTGQVLDGAIPKLAPAEPTYSDGYHSAHFSPDGTRLLLAANFYNERGDGRTDPRSAFRVFEVGASARALTGQVNLPAAMNPGPHARPTAAFSPDGQMVLSVLASFAPHAEYVGWGRPFGEARTWDAQTGESVSAPLRHTARCEAVFSPDSTRVLTAGEDGLARVWDARTGSPLTPPMKHPLAVAFAEFSPDGRRILTVDYDGATQQMRVWDSASGEAISPPLKLPESSVSARLAPDGLSVLAATLRSVVLWRLRSDDRPLDELASFCNRLALHRIDQFGAYVPLEQ